MEINQAEPPSARFQRTDQWKPVYSWLESLDKSEVVKSKDISDWLSENPKVKEQLYSRHSRGHLMHYIQKCHLKILRRQEKQKGLQHSNTASRMKVGNSGASARPIQLPQNSSFKSNDIYLARRNEAWRKYQLLIELEKRLAPIMEKHREEKKLPVSDSQSMLRQKSADNATHPLSDINDGEGNINIMSCGSSHSVAPECVAVDRESGLELPSDLQSRKEKKSTDSVMPSLSCSEASSGKQTSSSSGICDASAHH